MKINSERDLEYAYMSIGKVICDRDRTLADTVLSPSLQASVVDGIEAKVRKIKRDIDDYHTRRLLEATDLAQAANIK